MFHSGQLDRVDAAVPLDDYLLPINAHFAPATPPEAQPKTAPTRRRATPCRPSQEPIVDGSPLKDPLPNAPDDVHPRERKHVRRQEDTRIRPEAEELHRTHPSSQELKVDYLSSPEFRLLRTLSSDPITTSRSPVVTPATRTSGIRGIPVLQELDPGTGSAAIVGAVTDLFRRRDERGLDRPWSIAELSLQSDDFLRLSHWAAGLDGRTARVWLGNSWTLETFPGGACYPRQACLGLLLLTFAAEAAHREATEGTLWPHVRRDNSGRRRFSGDVDYELFDHGGHPTAAFKHAIESAAQFFGLRNVLQDLDSQRYYLTVFLQFGFTIRDAKLRLGQWLTGATIQTATGHLLATGGPLHAPGFVSMWETLKNSAPETCRPRLFPANSLRVPGCFRIGPTSFPDSLAATPAGKWMLRSRASGGFDMILSEPELRWSPPEPPYLLCRLENLAMAGLVAPEYELRVCGRRLARISRAEDGSYDATAEEVPLPAFAPAVSGELIEREAGEVAAALTLTCFDPDEIVAVFELPSGRRLKPGDRLRPTRDYALIFAPDLLLDPPGAC